MTAPHFSVSIVARGSGRSAVLSAAYRHCSKMEYEREARIIDYTRKRGLLHEEFVIPPDAPYWLQSMIAGRGACGASEAFWNRIELFEKRSDAQLAKDVTIALPVELDDQQNIALVRAFVSRHVTAHGMVADWVYHDVPGNPHVHLMTTLRPLTEDGFGAKKVAVVGPGGNPLRTDSGKIVYELWAGGINDFNAFREGWFACQNEHLALAGLDIHIDGRSFDKQGIELMPTMHVGVGAKAIERKAEVSPTHVSLERIELQEERRAENARHIQRDPGIVLDLITRERSVFDERDVAKILSRYIDDVSLFQSLMVRVFQRPEALRLDRERFDFATGKRVPARYTTRALIQLEAAMANRAIWLSQRESHAVSARVLEGTFARQNHLSEEQRAAIGHICGGERIAAVVGRAGAGKTTMMRVARKAWEEAGYTVVGGALAGKAAEGLEQEAGIISHTLSSWELRWCRGENKLDEKTIIVLDEAGMVSSRQMAIFVEAATRTGAKLVLIGDPEQLQPIEAGAAFRAIADRIGYAELKTIYRQREQWMREASLDLAHGRVGNALNAYRVNGMLLGAQLKADAIGKLIADWSRDHDPAGTSLILAHLRRDVRVLNEMARAKLIERGLVDEGYAFETTDGKRQFAAGDQIVFLRNEGSLGVKNGMLARVAEASPGRLVVELGDGQNRRRVMVEQRFYNDVDHGYATTIHKSQGATVDRVKVLASLSLDRHLAYVAMTRHRQDLAIYYARGSFAKAGGLRSVLERGNSKETTLDYAPGSLYRQALRFAEARGMNLINVARTLVRDRLEWTVLQKRRLTDLASQLTALAERLGIVPVRKATDMVSNLTELKPMVAGVKVFAKSLQQAVDDRLADDAVLKRQWAEVSARFSLVYVRPALAFKAVDVVLMLANESAARSTIAAIVADPESFGALNGKTGVFASNRDREERQKALLNVPALARNLERYLRQRAVAAHKHRIEEETARTRISFDIPALSAGARRMLEIVRDAIERNDLHAGLEHTQAEKQIKVELDGFAKAVSKRFGERTFLSISAKEPGGETFQKLTSGMSASRKTEIQAAWSSMRTIQELEAHQRTTAALKQSQTSKLARREGFPLK